MRLCRDLFSQPSPAAVLTQLDVWAKTLLGASTARASLASGLRRELADQEARDDAQAEEAERQAMRSGTSLSEHLASRDVTLPDAEAASLERHRSAVSRVRSRVAAGHPTPSHSLLTHGSPPPPPMQVSRVLSGGGAVIL